MRITIHRAEQIGGQITRISTANTSIIIDLGHNLPKNEESEDVLEKAQVRLWKSLTRRNFFATNHVSLLWMVGMF